MANHSRGDNYFVEPGTPAPGRPDGLGEQSEQSRFISAQFEGILDALPFYVLLVDTGHRIQFANKAFRKTYKMSLSEIQGTYCPKLVHKCDHFNDCALEHARAHGITESIHYNKDHGRWLLTTAYPTGVKTKEGLELYYHTVRDVTDEHQAEEALKTSESRYRRLFEEIKDVIFVLAPDGTLQDLNPAGLELLQIQPHKLGRTNLFVDLNLTAEQREEFLEAMQDMGRISDFEASFVRPDGKTIILSINAGMELGGPQGGTIRGIMRDMTRNRELEELSTTDALTGLYNRGFFQTFLLNRIRSMRPGQEDELSLLFFDIDDFKSYNDTYGHLEGDYILKKVASAIRDALRVEDIPARYGGEEFAVILNMGAAKSLQVADRVRRTIEEACSDFSDSRIKRGITISIGLATLGTDGDNPDRLVKIADRRMYEAKKRGKNQVYAGPVMTTGLHRLPIVR